MADNLQPNYLHSSGTSSSEASELSTGFFRCYFFPFMGWLGMLSMKFTTGLITGFIMGPVVDLLYFVKRLLI